MNSSTNIHSLAYTVFLILLAASLPLSKFTMSVTEFSLLGLWLWSGFSFTVSYRFFKLGGFFGGLVHFIRYVVVLAATNFVEKFKELFKNIPVLVFLSIFAIHVIGLIYTADIEYAFKDLRIKLPLLLLPVVISTMEKQNSRQTRTILSFYILSVFVSTLFSAYYYFTSQYVDIREISRFVSPIRLGLNVCFAIAIIIYFVFHDGRYRISHKIVMIAIAFWFISFLFIMEAMTSIFIIIVIFVCYLLWRVFITMIKWQKVVFLIIGILIPVVFLIQVYNIVIKAVTPPPINIEQIDKFTSRGNPYNNDFKGLRVEDGKYVNLFVCQKELAEEWNKRSELDYDGNTYDGQYVNETLVRFLTSKGLRKDADGVAALTEEDIVLVENGLANYNYVHNPGLKTRILKIIKGYEVYMKTGNPSGSSVMQRVEYIRASFNIICNNFLFGVGTGDLEDAFNEEFKKMNSALEDQYKYHAHNQFLGIFVALGLFGFVVFVIGLFYPPFILRGFSDYFFSVFFVIIVISMFSDDTIETQAGATLFSFFYSFLLFGRKIGDKMPAGIDD